MTTQKTPLLPAERELFMKERATLLDRLAFVEQRLGLPSSIVPKQERRNDAYTERVRQNIKNDAG